MERELLLPGYGAGFSCLEGKNEVLTQYDNYLATLAKQQLVHARDRNPHDRNQNRAQITNHVNGQSAARLLVVAASVT